MQRERQEEIENEVSMEENAGPLLINKLEVQLMVFLSLMKSLSSLFALHFYSHKRLTWDQ